MSLSCAGTARRRCRVIVSVLLGEVLRDRYFPERVRAICLQRGISMKHDVFTYPPELVTALVHSETLPAGGKLRRYLYPDPPLGVEELLLLRQFDPNIDPVTRRFCGRHE